MFRYSYTDNLPERFGKTFAQEWKKSTPVWLASLKNVVAWAPNEGAAWRLSPSLAVADPGEGPKGAPPIIFRLNSKKNFWWPPPPPPALSQSPNDRTPPHPLSQGLNSALCRVDGRRADSVSYPDLCEWGLSDLIYIWTDSFESAELRQRLRLESSVEIMWTSGLTQILRRSFPSYGDVLLHTVDDKIPLYFWVGAELRFLECSKGRN